MCDSGTLMDQLANAPERHIRAVLLSLCGDDAIKTKALERYSDLIEFEQLARSLKRKATDDICICVQCNSPFFSEDNEDGDCLYHTGETVMREDREIWDRVEIQEIDDPDCPEYRHDFPEGFHWNCCRLALHIKGCVRGRHEADPQKSRRGWESPHYKREAADFPTDDEEEAEQVQQVLAQRP